MAIEFNSSSILSLKQGHALAANTAIIDNISLNISASSQQYWRIEEAIGTDGGTLLISSTLLDGSSGGVFTQIHNFEDEDSVLYTK